MWNEIQSISETITRREEKSFRRGKEKISRVKRAWSLRSASDETTSRRSSRLHVLLEQLKFYCENSSLAGYKYITEIQRTWFERVMWIILQVVMIYSLGAIIYNVLEGYKHTPVITVVESDHYPSNILDLPAVSVCSINRISRRNVMKLAGRIKTANITDLDLNEIMNLLQELGSLYQSSYHMHGAKQNELNDLLTKFFDGELEVTQLMKELQLTPQCSDILVKCRFRSVKRNCSELFSFRKTHDGFCCTFNYAREKDDISGTTTENRIMEKLKVTKIGMLNGLSFVLDAFLDDYFYPILPFNGWKITIFNPADYPDDTSGSVTNALISPGTENFLELNAVSFFSEPSVRRYSMGKRKCVFLDEVKALFDGYTYSDCLVHCKVDDIFETCKCRPFFFPKRNSRRVCNTSDVPCLQKYKSKWLSIMPYEVKSSDEDSKMFNFISNESWSLRCKNCYPSCEDIHYYLQTSRVNLEKNEYAPILRDLDIANHSLVHIFFSKYATVRLKQDITYYWYELLSNIGGICGVFIGFSLISIVEFIYFFVISGTHLFMNSNNRSSESVEKNDDDTLAVSPNMRPLYWTELVPQSNMNNSKKRASTQ